MPAFRASSDDACAVAPTRPYRRQRYLLMRRFAPLILLLASWCFVAGCRQAADPEPEAPADTASRADVPEPHVAPTPLDRHLEAFFSDADSLREAIPALGTGNVEVLTVDVVRNVNVYARALAHDVAIVAVNRSGEAHSLRVELPERLRYVYEVAHATEPEGYRLQQDATALLLDLPERFGLILTPRTAE